MWHRECGDPRDKIFGVLSTSTYLDTSRSLIAEEKADYAMTNAEVYEYYSRSFTLQHGPGYFLALIKSPPKLSSLPSWAADWRVPWLNYKAAEGRDFAACSRPMNKRDIGANFSFEDGWHVDDETACRVEDIAKSRKESEALIQVYPGMAALSTKEDQHYVFSQVCPNALSERGVEDLASRWSEVVVDGMEPRESKHSMASNSLGPLKLFKIQ